MLYSSPYTVTNTLNQAKNADNETITPEFAMLHKMEAIYQEKLDRKMVELGNEGKDCCERCDKHNSSPDPEDHFSPNVEAFEISGQIVCDECAEEIFEENSQFGVGA